MGPIVTIRTGRVEGAVRDGVSSFLGIPYAASPTGERRFAAPAPAAAWDGIRAGTEFGPTPPVPGYRPPSDDLLFQPVIPGDDWLNLNVWTPDPDAAGLPVMVWLYGGAFVNGNTAIPMYDGHAFARDGVVLVSANFRIGVEGFAALPGAPTNRGLLDQVAALEWVRDNIAAFGGDPDAVTLFGESAGAMSVTTLLAMPSARGLFARAIMQSGSVQAAASPADAALVTGELAAALDLDADDLTAQALATLDPADLLTAQVAVSDALAMDANPDRFGASIVASSMAFIPVVDGEVLPVHPMTAIASGACGSVPLLTGTTSEEFRLFIVPAGLADAIDQDALVAMAGKVGADESVLTLYRANRPDATPGDVFAAIVTDRYFRMPMIGMLDARRAAGGAPAWVYEFAWGTTHKGLGAAHAMELPFVFDTLDAKGADWLTGPDAPQSLADEMHATWVRFAASGDPGWAPYDVDRVVMTFDLGGAGEVADPRGDERAIWML